MQKVVTVAKQIQKGCRQILNPAGDKVTLTNYMVLVAMDEDTTREKLALGLDFASKCGLLKKTSAGKWIEGHHPQAQRAYVVVGAKNNGLI